MTSDNSEARRVFEQTLSSLTADEMESAAFSGAVMRLKNLGVVRHEAFALVDAIAEAFKDSVALLADRVSDSLRNAAASGKGFLELRALAIVTCAVHGVEVADSVYETKIAHQRN